MFYDVNGNVVYDSKKTEFADNMTLDYQYDATTNANYTVLRIFQTKKDGTKQYPFVRSPGRMSALDLMGDEDWLLIINAGLGVSANQPIDGVVIENGIVINGDPCTYHVGSQPLTIDGNGNLGYTEANETGASILSDGAVSAVCGFCPIIIDFEKTQSFPNVSINGEGNHFTQNAQRQIIGQFGNGDYGIVSCEGRTYDNSDGWTLSEAQDICQKLGFKFAYNLDGGNSVATIVNKKLITEHYRHYSTNPRLLPTFIVFNGTTTYAIPS